MPQSTKKTRAPKAVSSTSKGRGAKMSSREKARAYRERMRAKGLRPVQFWLPDVNSPEFIAEAHRQSLAISNSPQAEEDQAFIDSLTSWDDE